LFLQKTLYVLIMFFYFEVSSLFGWSFDVTSAFVIAPAEASDHCPPLQRLRRDKENRVCGPVISGMPLDTYRPGRRLVACQSGSGFGADRR
jgi:hypothetical protein